MRRQHEASRVRGVGFQALRNRYDEAATLHELIRKLQRIYYFILLFYYLLFNINENQHFGDGYLWVCNLEQMKMKIKREQQDAAVPGQVTVFPKHNI